MNPMELLPDSGKLTIMHATNVAMQKPGIIPALIELSFENKYQFSTRASRVVEAVDVKMPQLIQPFYMKIIEALPASQTEGVKRSFLKMLSKHTDIDNEAALCTLLNFCFDVLINPKTEIAVKFYSMDIIYSISLKEPDLQNELVSVIKAQMSEASVGFCSKGQKIIVACRK